MEEITNRTKITELQRQVSMEINFQEKLAARSDMCTRFTEEVWENIILKAIPSNWHDSGKDEIEFLVFYNDNTYFCQKKRNRYDFETKSSYWASYVFKEGSNEQARELYELFESVGRVQKQAKRSAWVEDVKKLWDRSFYYQAKYVKKISEIQKLLLYSDWRILPDAPEKMENEKEMWIKWRDELRKLMKPLDDFETPYKAFEYASKIKIPLDPRIYLKEYPNQEVEYLSTEDQYVKQEFMASNDWVASRILDISDYAEKYIPEEVVVTEKIKKLLSELKFEKYFPYFDFEKYVKEQPLVDTSRGDNPSTLKNT